MHTMKAVTVVSRGEIALSDVLSPAPEKSLLESTPMLKIPQIVSLETSELQLILIIAHKNFPLYFTTIGSIIGCDMYIRHGRNDWTKCTCGSPVLWRACCRFCSRSHGGQPENIPCTL